VLLAGKWLILGGGLTISMGDTSVSVVAMEIPLTLRFVSSIDRLLTASSLIGALYNNGSKYQQFYMDINFNAFSFMIIIPLLHLFLVLVDIL
jgi:hypothetical protein